MKAVFLKSQSFQRKRKALRQILILSVVLKQKSLKNKGNNYSEIQHLERLLNNSICQCPTCSHSDKDIIFNLALKAWYCVDCYELHKRFYKECTDNEKKGIFLGDFNKHIYKTFK